MIDCYLGLSRSMHALQDGSNVSFLLGDPMVKWKVWAKKTGCRFGGERLWPDMTTQATHENLLLISRIFPALVEDYAGRTR
jgi:hypothetical protein